MKIISIHNQTLKKYHQEIKSKTKFRTGRHLKDKAVKTLKR